MDSLTEMHLALREHGWVPECHNSCGQPFWEWHHPDRPGHAFSTSRHEPAKESDPDMLEPDLIGVAYNATYNVAALRRRLKALATGTALSSTK